jgi:hypothetical protein
MDTPVLNRFAAIPLSREIPCPARLSPDFHSRKNACEQSAMPAHPRPQSAKLAPRLPLPEIALRAAQNPVTLLWTPCTRLKMRSLHMQVFD